MGKKRISVCAAALAASAVGWTVLAPPMAAAGEPTVGLSASSVKPGVMIVVSLTAWPVGPVTVSVCGNQAARGSQDCDLPSAQGAGVADPTTQTLVQLVVVRPPPPCPCVVMVANAAHDVVKSVPLVIQGVPTGPVVSTVPIGPLLEVKAKLGSTSASLLDQVMASTGGRVARTLELQVKNLGTRASPEIIPSAAVGRSINSGESLTMPPIGPLAPGETRLYTIPVTLTAPSHGRYMVSGTLDGYGDRVDFATATSTTPVLLVILCAGLVADLAVLLLRRARRRHAMAAETAGVDMAMPVMARAAIAAADPEVVARARRWWVPVKRRRAAWVEPSPISAAFVARLAQQPDRVFPVTPDARVGPVRRTARVASPRASAEHRFFHSTKAAVVTCAVVAALAILVLAAALPTSTRQHSRSATANSPRLSAPAPPGSGGQPAPANGTAPGAAPGSTTVPTGGVGSGSPVGPGPTTAPGVVPGEIRVVGNTNARDGQAVTVTIIAGTGSQIFGFDIRLCAGDAAFRFDSDIRPTQGGKCVLNPLSAASEASQEIQADPPFSKAETTFRVGVGTDRFKTTGGREVTITCGPGHPCQLALKVQFPGGFAFRSYPVTYA